MDFCCELQKLPTLFEHYEEHTAHDSITILSFLELHYGGEQSEQEDHHSDEHDKQLPFQGQHQCAHGIVFITPHFKMTEAADFDLSTQTQQGIYCFSYSSEYLDSPFQPPKA